MSAPPQIYGSRWAVNCGSAGSVKVAGGGIDASGFAAKKYAALRVCKAAYRVLFLCRNNRRLRDLEPEEPREEAFLLALFVGFVLLLYRLGVLRFVLLRLDMLTFSVFRLGMFRF